MSILYCAIPNFAVALARRDRPELAARPLVLLDAEERVFDASPDVAERGVTVGLTAHTVQVRCPGAHLEVADLDRCRSELKAFLEVLEEFSPSVEPHGWGAAYVDLGDAMRDRARAVAFCKESGRSVRQALGQAMQPALGWNKGKFTARVAARCTQPGHLLPVDAEEEHAFLSPLPVTLLPLSEETVRRLHFLGLRTLGQYAALPVPAVWQQFGRAGKLAHRLACGKDDRPVIARRQAPTIEGGHTFETPTVSRERVLAVAQRVIDALFQELSSQFAACGSLRLVARMEDGSAVERARTFLFPVSDRQRIGRAVDDLLDGVQGKGSVAAISIALEQIQEAVMEQLTLFSDQHGDDHQLRQVQRYLVTRFGASRLRRASLIRPQAPLPEWRILWQEEDPT
ncbi:MAG: hypothetical protein JXA09_15760 [Anaerolineae bacterium]|nr:hypothetical protein [Anaerolineae bacterium]